MSLYVDVTRLVTDEAAVPTSVRLLAQAQGDATETHCARGAAENVIEE